MKITRVVATPLNVPVRIQLVGVDRETSLSACVVDVETDTGAVGHGFTAITEEEVVASVINDVAAPALIGGDGPAEFAQSWQAEIERWSKVAHVAKITAD